MRMMLMLIAAAVWLFAAQARLGAASAPNQNQASEPDTKTDLEKTLTCEPEPHCKTLADLATQQGLNPQDYLEYRYDNGLGCQFSKWAYVERVQTAEGRHLVFVETLLEKQAQQLVLLTPNGKILDRIQCDINSRYGAVTTDILSKPVPDGTCIIIRFVGQIDLRGKQLLWHNWHTIAFRGKRWTFWAREQHTPNLWNEKGLCRIGIADGKFVVLFPKLATPDLSKTKLLKVGYRIQGIEKHLAVDDPKQISDLLSTITIKGRSQYCYPEGQETECVGGEHSQTRVDFILPNGDVRKMAFVTNRMLDDARGGRITLATTAFFDAISKAVAKAEGRGVDLLAKPSAL